MLGYNQSYIWHTPRQKHPSSSTKQHPSTFPRLSVLSTTSQEGGLGGGLEPEQRRLRGRVLPQPLDRPCKATQHRPQNPTNPNPSGVFAQIRRKKCATCKPKSSRGTKAPGGNRTDIGAGVEHPPLEPPQHRLRRRVCVPRDRRHTRNQPLRACNNHRAARSEEDRGTERSRVRLALEMKTGRCDKTPRLVGTNRRSVFQVVQE